MRIVIGTSQRLLGKTLAFCLLAEGHEVPEIAMTSSSLRGALLRHRADVLVVDETIDLREIARDDPMVAIVRLAAASASTLPDSSGERSAVAARTTTLPALVRLIAGAAATSQRREPVMPVPRLGGGTSPADFLTAREREVLTQLVLGADTGLLARRLGISRGTARDYIQSVFTKMQVHSRLELVSRVTRSGLVDPATGVWKMQPADAIATLPAATRSFYGDVLAAR